MMSDEYAGAWEHAMDDNTELNARIKELEDERDALTECLNGSSKAVYTAEVFDKAMSAKDARIRELEALVEFQSTELEDIRKECLRLKALSPKKAIHGSSAADNDMRDRNL